MAVYDYDVVVLGGGSAGLTAAKLAAARSKSVALIEKEKLGGEYTWTGSVPSNTLIRAAFIAYRAQHLQQYGLSTQEPVRIDSSSVLEHIRAVLLDVYRSHQPDVLAKKNVNLLFGDAAFIDNHTLSLNNQIITFKSCILATGSKPFIPDITGLDGIKYLTNATIFNLQKLPATMVIVGGGVVGCELAHALQRLGVAVTIVEKNEQLLSHEDRDLVALVTKKFEYEGITIKTESNLIEAGRSKDGDIQLTLQLASGKHEYLKVDHVLLATGRRPNFDGLHLHRAKVKAQKTGIVVDKTLQTSAKNIYACGDVVGPSLFNHMAFHQASVAAYNVVTSFPKKLDYDHSARVIFTDPVLASVGMTEAEARKKYGDTIRVHVYQCDQFDCAQTFDRHKGLGKFIVDANECLLGAHIFGDRAGELISEIQLGKVHTMFSEKLYKIIHPHSSYQNSGLCAMPKRNNEKPKYDIFSKYAHKLFRWLES